MAEAQITLKLTPREFDDVRQSLQSTFDQLTMMAKDKDIHAKDRSEYRVRAERLDEMILRLGSPS